MDDQQSAELRRRAQQAGLGVDLSQVDDHAVAELVAWAAPAGGDMAGLTLRKLSPKLTVAAAAPPPSAPARPRQAAAASAPAAPSMPSLNIDAVAMAQTLREAARNGKPFCEECERLRQQRAVT